MSPLVLVVDDERKIRDLVRSYLERAGIDVLTTASGAEAIVMARRSRPDLVVLDLGLPDVPGDEVAREIREAGDLPILMLPARATEADRVHGLELGADDYVTKPFSPRELVARVRAVLKRTFDQTELEGGTKVSGHLTICRETRQAAANGVDVNLNAREFELLWFLVTHPGKVFSRLQLLEKVWHFDWPGDESTVTVHVRRLRTKVELNPEQPVHLKTVWGAGYRWDS